MCDSGFMMTVPETKVAVAVTVAVRNGLGYGSSHFCYHCWGEECVRVRISYDVEWL